MSNVMYPVVWAWRFPDGSLGKWAKPFLADLVRETPPCPDAEPARCRLVPVREYTAIRRGLKP